MNPFLLDPQLLVSHNKSLKAANLRVVWTIVRDSGQLILKIRCGDARVIVSDPSIARLISLIAAGGEWGPLWNLIIDPSVTMVVIVVHFDGNTAIPGQMPSGCGGLFERGHIGEVVPTSGPGRHVGQYVFHPDMLVHGTMVAAELISRFGKEKRVEPKPIMVVAQDHLTGLEYPIAVYTFDQGTYRTSTKIPPGSESQKVYDSELIYANGVPQLQDNELALIVPYFLGLLRTNRKRVEELRGLYPNYQQIQKVQNPKSVLVTTDTRPIETCYGDLFGSPNSLFALRMARFKSETFESGIDEAVYLEDKPLIDALMDQLLYPIVNCNNAQGDVTQAFGRLSNLIIVTGSIVLSRRLGQDATQMDDIKRWKEEGERQVIVVQQRKGEVEKVELVN